MNLSGIEIPGYEIHETIGSGGFGTVVRARDVRFGRDVAIKVGHQPITDPDVARRFDRECRALGSVSGHSHIVSVSGAGQLDDGRPWLAMEYHAGGSLADRVERDGPLEWADVRSIGLALTKALRAAHDVGVLHRDLKPENVLMSRWGDPVLVDFGIARLANEAPTVTTSVTASIAYAPPEVLSGSPPDPRSDVYSLAATLAGVLLGHSPFDVGGDATMAARIARVITGPPPDLSGVPLPPGAADLLTRAMAHDPQARPQTMEAFEDALEVLPAAVGASEGGTTHEGTVTIGPGVPLPVPGAPAPPSAAPPPPPSGAPSASPAASPSPPAPPSTRDPSSEHPTSDSALAPPSAPPAPDGATAAVSGDLVGASRPTPPPPPGGPAPRGVPADAPPDPPGSPSPPGSAGPSGPEGGERSRRGLLIGGLVALVAVLAGGLGVWAITSDDDSPPPTRRTAFQDPEDPDPDPGEQSGGSGSEPEPEAPVVPLSAVVVQPAEVPAGFSAAPVGLAGADRPTVCNVYPLTDAIVAESATEYNDPVGGTDLASEVIEFETAGAAAAWMTLFEGLPDQCVTWDFAEPDGSVSVWDSQLRESGDPFNASQVSIVARTDFDYGCIVNAFAERQYVVRTTLCGTAPIDDATLDQLTNLTGDRLPG